MGVLINPYSFAAGGVSGNLVDEATTTANVQDHTWSGLDFGNAASDRVLVAVISWCLSVDSGLHSIETLTIGGVSATRAVRGAANDTRQLNSEIWYAEVPSGTSGDVVENCDGNAAQYRAIQLYRLTGMSSAPLDTDGNESATDLSLSVTAGGFAVALSTNQASTAIPTLTGITNSTGVSVGPRHGCQFGAQETPSTTTLTIGSDVSGTNTGAKCAASWQIG